MSGSLTNIFSKTQLGKPVYSASLCFFRAVFGVMILGGIIRFWLKGWIDELYIKPTFFFHYYGFSWVQPLGQYTYLIYAICAVSSFCFAIGFMYRAASFLLFLSFTYIELMDKTNYLNHYYFVSLVLFVMMWLPANVNFSVDAWRKPALLKRYIPLWTVGAVRLLLALVYIYAGLAKLNSDWLVNAMPLKLWLPANNHVPLIGWLLNYTWIAYAFSWFASLYDLSIPFLLLKHKTRPYALVAVLVFHVLTSILFPIGMFPYIMITAALVFFKTETIDAWLLGLRGSGWKMMDIATTYNFYSFSAIHQRLVVVMFLFFFALQILLPWRYLLYPGELFWTEEGYRFSWRVMLIEKMGYAQFIVKDGVNGKQIAVNNNDFLTKNQEKMMATQSDFIVQYAQHLKQHYIKQGMVQPRVYATIYVTLNGRRSRLYIDENTDLATQQDGFEHKKWILPLGSEIYGL